MQNRGMLILPNLYQTWVRFYILQTILDQISPSSLLSSLQVSCVRAIVSLDSLLYLFWF